jgi:hypothetical protein
MDGDEDANHTYFANGLLVHNGGSGGGGGGGGGCRGGGVGYYDDTGTYNYGSDYNTGGTYGPAAGEEPSNYDPNKLTAEDHLAVAPPEPVATPDTSEDDSWLGKPDAEESPVMDGGSDIEGSPELSQEESDAQSAADLGISTEQFNKEMAAEAAGGVEAKGIRETPGRLTNVGEGSGSSGGNIVKEDIGLHSGEKLVNAADKEEADREAARDKFINENPDDLNALKDFDENYDNELKERNKQELADKLEKQENLENIDSHKDYNTQLQEMWDDPDQKGDLTANELQQLKDSNFIKGDVNQISGAGATGDTANLSDAQPVDSTSGKIEQGQQLSQVDYQNLANLPENERAQAYNEMNPDGSLESAMEFANLTGSSVVSYLSQQNIASLAQDPAGYQNLSMADKSALIHDQGLELSREAALALPQEDWDDYYNMKHQPMGTPVPDPNKDPEGYRNYNDMKNRVYVSYVENDPEFRGKRAEWVAKNLATKGLNYGKKKLRQFANMKVQGALSVAAQTMMMSLVPGSSVLPTVITSALYSAIMKNPRSILARETNQLMNSANLTPTEATSMGDAFDSFDGSPEGQAAFESVSQRDDFKSQVDNNWNNMNGMVHDPNNTNMEAGIGGMTAIYGYNRDGIPMTREEAEDAGVNVTQKEQYYKDSGTSINQYGHSDNLIDDAGQSYSGEAGGESGEESEDDGGDGGDPVNTGGSEGDGGDDKAPSEILDGGDDVPNTTSGGAPNERWERFMEMMEKRASGEADSLSEKAMKREREEGLKERMAMMAMGRGQPSAAGLRTYDRAKGAADRELAGDAAVARQQEMQIAQGQFGDALSSQLDRESRERVSKYSDDMDQAIKGMTIEEAKRKGKAKMWLDGVKVAWGMFGGDIEKWIKDGWTKKTAKEAIESNGGTVSGSKDPVGGGDSGSYSPPVSSIYDHSGNNYPITTPEQDDNGYYYYDEDQRTWIWDAYAEGGKVEGPGTETSDDIPALLSDGEFVIKASAVKGLGRSKGAKDDKEARDKGIELLYELQNKYGDLEEYSHGGAAFGDVLAERRLLDRNRVRGGRNV